MGAVFPQPQHIPCTECGASVEQALLDEHFCDPERLLDYVMFQLRAEVDAMDGKLAAYLDSPRGRFDVWCAERDRRLRGR